VGVSVIRVHRPTVCNLCLVCSLRLVHVAIFYLLSACDVAAIHSIAVQLYSVVATLSLTFTESFVSYNNGLFLNAAIVTGGEVPKCHSHVWY